MNHEGWLYQKLSRWVLGHRKLVAILAVMLGLVSAAIGIPPEIDSNLLNLLPDSDPGVRMLRKINEEEGGLNLLTLTYRADDPEKLGPFLDDLQARFEALDDVDFAMHALDPNLAKQVGLLQFEPEEVGKLNDRLRGALALGSALNPLVTQKLMEMGPLTEKIQKASGVGLFGEGEKERGRLIVRPTQTSADPVFARQFMEEVEVLMEGVDEDAAGVELLWMGGAYRHNVEDLRGIQQDLMITSVGSAVIVLVVMILSFRSPWALLIVFPPLVLASIVQLAFARLATGPLNTFTSFATAILFGLGIDFAVHLVGRYREKRMEGLSKEDAVVAAWMRTGPPCTTAALTSAAGFLALATAEFAGFAQLGVLLAFGLVCSLLAMLVLLPLLLVALDDESRPLLGTVSSEVQSESSYAYSPPGVGLMIVLTIAIAVFAIPRLPFEYDVSALRRDGMSYAELSEAERALARESYSPVVAFYEGAAGELEADQERMEALIAAGGLDHVAAAVSIANVLPRDQQARNAEIAELVELLEHKNMRYLPVVLVKRLIPFRGLDVRELTRDDLPEAMLLLLGANNPDAPRMLLLPKGNMWDVREAGKLKAEVEHELPDRPLAGEYLGVASMFNMVWRDAPKVAGIALLFVALLAWRDLRKPLFVAGAVTTLVAGMVWAGGAVWLSGVKLTMVNLTGVPILLGIGVDVVIHLLHRLQEEGPGGVRKALRTTGVAASISTVTTMGSFLSLTLAGNRGVRSLGLLIVIGLAVVFVISAFLLPLVWSAGWKLAGLAPADQED